MKTLYQLKYEAQIPPYAIIQIPDDWVLSGYVRHEKDQFEYQPTYSKDGVTLTESELLVKGLAYFYVENGRYSRQCFRL